MNIYGGGIFGGTASRSSYTLATRPSAAAVPVGTRIFVTDAGAYGHWFISNGAYWNPIGEYLLYSKTAAESSHTGTTNETLIRSIPIPALTLRNNGTIRGQITWSFTNSADDKVLRVRLGGIAGTAFVSRTVTTNAAGIIEFTVSNRDAANSQIGGPAVGVGIGENNSVAVTSSVDTTAATTLDITAQLENAANAITIQRTLIYVS